MICDIQVSLFSMVGLGHLINCILFEYKIAYVLFIIFIIIFIKIKVFDKEE